MVDIQAFLDSYEDSVYDIRQTRIVRFADQKCTPDIVSFIADCILNTSCCTAPFKCKDLWRTNYLKENSRIIFGKPFSDNKKAAKEYDKIISQPLTLLACANVLTRKKHSDRTDFNPWVYSINNREILEYIAMSDENAYKFMLPFFRKVIAASNMSELFTVYKEESQRNVRTAHRNLYKKFRLICDEIKESTTSKKKENESDRILHKVLNVLAYDEGYAGSNFIPLSWTDLFYNKVNRRDSNKKKKSITRDEHEKQISKLLGEQSYKSYAITKAMRNVHRKQGETSEIDDELSTGVATNVHHIFPKNTYPEIATKHENLILLTASQHYQKAHPDNYTQIIDKDYQYRCLLSKLRAIETCEQLHDDFYTRERFIEVVNKGTNSTLAPDSTFDEILNELNTKYTA